MANDRKKKMNNDGKNNTSKRNSISASCKPCAPIEPNGIAKELNDTTRKPSSTQMPTLDAGTCYSKCNTSIQQVSTKQPSGTEKNTTSKFTSLKSDVKLPAKDCEMKPLSVTNPFIEKMEEDILYHIALGNKSHDLPKMFGDVKFVVMGGTPKRMEQFAYFIASEIGYELPAGTILNDISKNSHRYAMFKVGPVLSVSHGMGTPSIGILLHELIKLMSHAGVKDPIFVRIATCGGFSKKAGTVVVSNKVVNDFMEPFYELAILGKKVRFPALLNETIVSEILACSESSDKFETIAGVTYCTDNFYEGSGRADGAICEFSEQDAVNYYKELQKIGVVNVEMESLAFAALTYRACIKSAVITVILSDRLETDQIQQSKEVLDEWQTRPQKLLAKYIKKKLSIGNSTTPTNPTTATKIGEKVDLVGTTSNSSNNSSSVCKPCTATGVEATHSAGLSTTRKFLDGATSKSVTNLPSVCKPCAITSIQGNEGVALSGEKKSSERTTSNPETNFSSVCKPCKAIDEKDVSTTKTVINSPSICKPCTLNTTSKADVDVTAKTSAFTTSKRTTEASEISSLCKPCKGSSAISTSASTDSSGTCKPCTETTSIAPTDLTSKSASVVENSSTKGKRSKCVPVKCYANEKVDNTRSVSTTPKTYLAKDFDSSSKSTISNDSWRSCYQKCSKMPASNGGTSVAQPEPTSSTTYKPNTFQTPEQDQMKGVSADQLGPCCASKIQVKEVEDVKGPCCVNVKQSNDAIKGEAEITNESIDEKNSLTAETLKNNSKMKENSNANFPTQPKQDAMRPVDSKATGPFCSKNVNGDSPEETCDNKIDRSHASVEEKERPKVDAAAEETTQGCPISIRTPCRYFDGSNSSNNLTPSKLDSISEATSGAQYSTPKPSPDTPDVTRAMPTFITPTPPSSKGSSCCSKFSSNTTTSILSSINKEANKYDESPSPCAACKKYQESKNKSFASTPSDSQPEIIKCAHKLKRLKEECQGYD